MAALALTLLVSPLPPSTNHLRGARFLYRAIGDFFCFVLFTAAPADVWHDLDIPVPVLLTATFWAGAPPAPGTPAAVLAFVLLAVLSPAASGLQQAVLTRLSTSHGVLHHLSDPRLLSTSAACGALRPLFPFFHFAVLLFRVSAVPGRVLGWPRVAWRNLLEAFIETGATSAGGKS